MEELFVVLKSVCCIHIYRDPEAVIQTSSNEAYGVTKTARARGGDAEYETVPAVPPLHLSLHTASY